MLDDDTTEAQRHRQTRILYEDTVDHYANWFKECQEDLDFHDGNQWEDQDVQFLQRQNRPVLTFNLTQGKILHLIGAHSDNMQEPVIAPKGPEDDFRAKVLDYIKCQVYREAGMDEVDAEVFEYGVKAGISGCGIDAMPDPANRSRVKIIMDPVHPIEILWDPGADRKDKSDASYMFWHRWLSVSRFKSDYPDYADKVDEIMNMRDGDTGVGYTDRSGGFGHYYSPDTWDWAPRREMLYYDRRKKMIRVVRMEYKKMVKKHELIGPNGLRREIPAGTRSFIRENYPQLTIESYNLEKFFWFEFTGHFTLYDDANPLPFQGFSVEPYVCASDDKNWPYGKVRMLKDPQREVNKRYSQTLHMVNSQIAPGIFAEQDSVVSEDQAKTSLKQAQSITWLNPGALAAGRIQERKVPAFPDGIARLHDASVKMFDFISGISADDMIEPRGIPEAAATTQLKHRKSMMSTKPLLQRFWSYQKNHCDKVIICIVKLIPDAQIMEYLANSEFYKMDRGLITTPDGKQQLSIRDLRGHQMNVELRPATANETERLLELQLLMALLQMQIPVSPEVIFEMLNLPDEKKARLKMFARQMAQSQAQASQTQMEMADMQLKVQAIIDMIGKGVDVEKVVEAHRHNVATEYLTGMKQGMDTQARMEELWERANESQRSAIIQLISERLKSMGSGQPRPAIQ